MSRNSRRFIAVIGLLLPLTLASCGGSTAKDSDSKTGPTGDQLAEVEFDGTVGEELKATWKSKVALPEKTTVTTLVRGDGDEIAEGDTVNTYLWVGNGSTKKQIYNDYEYGATEAIPHSPEMGEVWSEVFEGATYGSRVVAVTTPARLFGGDGSENPLGLGEDDAVVMVADFVDKQEASPTPTDDKAHDVTPDKMPAVVESQGKPTGLDFTGIEEPELDTPVQRVVLKEGKGAKVEADDTVTVNYLGATFDAKEPFDESFSADPLTSSLSGLIPGWSIGLEGVTVGSRVLVQIPPAYGYGTQGSGAIESNATLWFVIDVVKAK